MALAKEAFIGWKVKDTDMLLSLKVAIEPFVVEKGSRGGYC